MAILKWRRTPRWADGKEAPAPAEVVRASVAIPRPIVAAALPLEGPDKIRVGRGFTAGAEDWQKEARYHYDSCGEFRSAVTWIANAVSKADLHAAELDEETGTVGEPTEDARVQLVAAAVLGGAVVRPQLLKSLAVLWQVPGECFIIVRPTKEDEPDEWLVMAASQVTFKSEKWSYTDPKTLAKVELTGKDRLIRVWEPHPFDPTKADSAARPALPVLREVEKSSQNIAARLDSRLAGNGVWLVPSEMDFPREEGMTKAESLMDYVLAAMEASLSNPGRASAQAPIIVEVPGEHIPNAASGFIDFSTTFDAGVVDLRTTALGRLAATLDMPNEIAGGSTGGMNHWGAWQVEESTYKIYIEPLLDRISDALTEHYFRPALTAMGVSDPERYVLAWDTTSIVARPERTGDLMELHERVLISDDYLRSEMGIPDDAIPADDERQRRELLGLVRVAPTLLADPQVGQELFGFELAPAAAGVDPEEADAAAGEQGAAPEPAGALPAGPDTQQRPDDEESVPQGLLSSAELIVFDALSRAGGRLLTRGYRGQFANTPKHELHTVIAALGDVPRLLEGSFQFSSHVAQAFGIDTDRLEACLSAYVGWLLERQLPHDPAHLRRCLTAVTGP